MIQVVLAFIEVRQFFDIDVDVLKSRIKYCDSLRHCTHTFIFPLADDVFPLWNPGE